MRLGWRILEAHYATDIALIRSEREPLNLLFNWHRAEKPGRKALIFHLSTDIALIRSGREALKLSARWSSTLPSLWEISGEWIIYLQSTISSLSLLFWDACNSVPRLNSSLGQSIRIQLSKWIRTIKKLCTRHKYNIMNRIIITYFGSVIGTINCFSALSWNNDTIKVSTCSRKWTHMRNRTYFMRIISEFRICDHF